MHKYALHISYVGTQYCGWQKQKPGNSGDQPSIQSTIESAIAKITGETAPVVGSGRTDSGVHSIGQVAHFVLRLRKWDSANLFKGLNSILPKDIRIISAQEVPLSFHAQHSSTKKQYSYYFQQGPCALPHLESYSWWIRKKLNLDAIQVALNFLKGTHDFQAFQASGAQVKSTIRQIYEAEVSWEPIPVPGKPYFQLSEDQIPFGLVRVRLLGSGFLKQMVRGIAGTLLQIGENRRRPEEMLEIINQKARSLVGPTAPARALWQEQVWYSE